MLNILINFIQKIKKRLSIEGLFFCFYETQVQIVVNGGKTGVSDHPKTESLTNRLIAKYTFKKCDTKRYSLDTYKCANSGVEWSVNIGTARFKNRRRVVTGTDFST